MERPDPDALLARVQAEESQHKRGKLKIFLGYAAGVGKTFAMLEAAHQRKVEGVDVAIGYIETHKRAETEALIEGLELVPRKQLEYHGTALEEMDVDAILARKPQLALVDEFAHTNAPGSRHPKRYLDVQELLAAGIDVYTTLNIQHLESLNDVVAQITGVTVRETIPDSTLDDAHDIQFIDLPPAELIQRLQEGKVYVPDQAARAIQRFFRQGNLTALREMALRRTAERVDDQMRAYMETRAIPGPWSASERLLVCVSPNPLGERLVRATRRLADELNAEWFATYVETPGRAGMSPAEREQVAGILQLVEELGGKAVTLPGNDVAETALEYARKNNITKVVAGKPLKPRWLELITGSVVDQLIRHGGNIDVYVVNEGAASDRGHAAPGREWFPHRPYRRYIQSVVLVAIATWIGFLVDIPLTLEKWEFVLEMLRTGKQPDVPFGVEPFLEPTNLVMIYLAAVVVAAIYLGRGPAILASFLSVLAFDFLFIPPYITFVVSDTQYILTFIGLFVVGLVISNLAAQVREQVEAAQRREAQTAELYDLSRDLAATADLDTILRALLRHVEQTFGRRAIMLMPENDRLVAFAAGSDLKLDENEMAVADWVFRHGEPAGRNTNTLPAASLRYLPLKTAHNVIGVLGVQGAAIPEKHLSPEQRRLMDAFATQAAIAIERAQFSEAARRAQMMQATEKLQTALLNSISHDLRTPLVSITGALSSLQEDDGQLAEANRRSLIENARAEAERLNRLVGNLLDMTRLEAGAMKVSEEPCDVQDAIGAALSIMEKSLEDRPLAVDIPEELPMAPMDFVLIVQVLVNLLDNAIKFSPPGPPIEVRARAAGGHLEIEVADRGVGIPKEDLKRVFNKFYRVQHPDNISGTGLGLSICKGIVEAHGGFISAENRAGGGTSITVALPLG